MSSPPFTGAKAALLQHEQPKQGQPIPKPTTAKAALLHASKPAPDKSMDIRVRHAMQLANVSPLFKSECVNFTQFGTLIDITVEVGWRFKHFDNPGVGRMLNRIGHEVRNFGFADYYHDVQKIKKGIINSLVFIEDCDVFDLVRDSGVFKATNKVYNHRLSQRYDYIWEQGQGGGNLDFTWNQIPERYPVSDGIDSDPKDIDDTPFLFLVETMAHNRDNFGNFLFGAAGAAMGLQKLELLKGADANGILNSKKNGYRPQLDSADDQLSISLGHDYATRRNYQAVVRP